MVPKFTGSSRLIKPCTNGICSGGIYCKSYRPDWVRPITNMTTMLRLLKKFVEIVEWDGVDHLLYEKRERCFFEVYLSVKYMFAEVICRRINSLYIPLQM